MVDAGNRVFVAAHSKEGAKLPDPIQIRRPPHAMRETDRADKRPATPEQLRDFFGPGTVHYTPKGGS